MTRAKGIFGKGKKRRGFIGHKSTSEVEIFASTSNPEVEANISSQYQEEELHSEAEATPVASTPVSGLSPISLEPSSSSSSKVKKNLAIYDSLNSNNKYDLVDVCELALRLKKVAVCKNCLGELSMSVTDRIGIASSLKLACENGCTEEVLRNSERQVYHVKDKEIAHEHINLRMGYAMRVIGKGHAAARKMCAIMNIPPPIFRYYSVEQTISSAVITVAKESMRNAVEEACILNESRDIPISLDGTWQKRGHTSLNGIVSAASMDTGKIIDLEVLSKFCQCPNKSLSEHIEECEANFLGTSGAMEVAGAKAIFGRSQDLYDVRYTHYLGDGDSKGFLKVVEMNPFGSDVKVQKLECVGHIQKRMGTRLRKLKATLKNTKLDDNKPIGGKGRLTDLAIDKLQTFYGLAIRRNTGSLENMKKAIWGSFSHVGSSDQQPVHAFCDEEWCKYRQSIKEGRQYKHSEHFHLPYAIMTKIKPIYQDLAHPKLLEKCLHGKTQNCNESFNYVVWSRVPKSTFVQIGTLRLGTYEAVAYFNEGFSASCKILKNLGIEPGYFCRLSLQKEDKIRINKSEKDYLENSKEMRLKRKEIRTRLEDRFSLEEGECSYAAGSF